MHRVARVLRQDRTHRQPCRCDGTATGGGSTMNNIIYIVGLVVVVLAILSFLGLR
ncbi:hypothetical protein [Bosea sp. Root483D1]|uniref:hypothetical protein n=1 Tax=Bosea sp. Root483D1 TaxID=1736544 RepID=UPI0012E397D8|nr:hypothetical protein [Bosea sp. Root483D1]